MLKGTGNMFVHNQKYLLKCTLRIIIQLSNTFDVIHAIWFANHHTKFVGNLPPSKASWTQRYAYNYKFQLVNVDDFYNKSKSETFLLKFAPMNFSLHQCLVWLGMIKQYNLIYTINIFWCHNQCGRGQCLPNSVQVVLYVRCGH